MGITKMSSTFTLAKQEKNIVESVGLETRNCILYGF